MTAGDDLSVRRVRSASYLADDEVERERDRLRSIAEDEENAERAERRAELVRQAEAEHNRRNADPVSVVRQLPLHRMT